MEETKEKTENEAFAMFSGYVYHPAESGTPEYWVKDNQYYHNLNYFDTWEGVMNVVQLIGVRIKLDNDNTYWTITKLSVMEDIKTIRRHALLYVKWYNDSKTAMKYIHVKKLIDKIKEIINSK